MSQAEHYKWVSIHPWQKKPPTDKQKAFISKHYGPSWEVRNRGHACALILARFESWERG